MADESSYSSELQLFIDEMGHWIVVCRGAEAIFSDLLGNVTVTWIMSAFWMSGCLPMQSFESEREGLNIVGRSFIFP
jgi:hypothetical protein